MFSSGLVWMILAVAGFIGVAIAYVLSTAEAVPDDYP